MKKSEVVFLNDNYKLILEVFDTVNDCKQYCYCAILKLQTIDGLPIIGEKFSFSVLCEKYQYIDLVFDFYLDKLQGSKDIKMVAYDLYLSALRDGNPTAKNL